MKHIISRPNHDITLEITKAVYGSGYSIDYKLMLDEKKIQIRYIDSAKKVIVFSNTISFDGKKVVGLKIADIYDDVAADEAALRAEIKKEEDDKAAAEKADIVSGKVKIECSYCDGDYLQAHEVFGIAAELLIEIGAAKRIDGWGTKVNRDLIDALGSEFTYADAVAYMQPAIDSAAEKKAAEAAALNEKFAEAKASGKPVSIRKWMSNCHGGVEDCSIDINIEYAMPDGTTKVTYDHCF